MAQTDSVYIQGGFSEPMSAQHNFANQYDLGNRPRAMSVYARYVKAMCSRHFLLLLIIHFSVMHQHTKQQLDMATNSARRRSQSAAAGLTPGSSVASSISSAS